MDDLIELNMRMAQHQMGDLNEAHRAYLAYATSCLARMLPSASELKRIIVHPESSPIQENPLAIMSVNREYLNYARLVAKDIISGQTEKLVILGMDWEQVEVVAKLSNQQITRLALRWNGLIYKFAMEVVAQGARLHPAAARIHAAAF